MSNTAKTSRPAKAKTSRPPKALLDLEADDCRWPIGEPRQPGFHFCCGPRLPGRPYCEQHWQIAFQPPRPRHQPPAVRPRPAKAA